MAAPAPHAQNCGHETSETWPYFLQTGSFKSQVGTGAQSSNPRVFQQGLVVVNNTVQPVRPACIIG